MGVENKIKDWTPEEAAVMLRLFNGQLPVEEYEKLAKIADMSEPGKKLIPKGQPGEKERF